MSKVDQVVPLPVSDEQVASTIGNPRERDAYRRAFDDAFVALGRIHSGAYRTAIGPYLDIAISALCDAQDKLSEFKGE